MKKALDKKSYDEKTLGLKNLTKTKMIGWKHYNKKISQRKNLKMKNSYDEKILWLKSLIIKKSYY